jgi:hypothetical protein
MHSCMEELLGFHVLDAVYRTTMNTSLQISFWHMISILLNICLEVQLLNHMVVLLLTF